MGAVKCVLINIAITLVFVVALELVFGNWVWGPEYGFINVPRDTSRTFDVSGLYSGGGKINYTRDKHGLRGPYRSLSKIDILTIGGSTTNQRYIDNSLTWQAQMRHLFSEAKNRKVIVDASVDGQSTKGHLAIFKKWFPNIPNLKAKHILVYAGINDTNVEAHQKFDLMESSKFFVKMRHWLMNKSAIYNLFRTIRGVFRAHRAKLIHGSGSPYTNLKWVKYVKTSASIPIPELEGRLKAYENRLKDLVLEIRGFGAEPIFVTQPTAEFRVDSGWVWLTRDINGKLKTLGYLTIKAFNQVTMEVCHTAGAICLDLASQVKFQDNDFYDRVHCTPKGAKKIALYLFNKLRPFL